MPANQTIPENFVQTSIIRAVQNVCARMIKREARFLERATSATYEGFESQPHVFGSVGFVGQINGVVYLCIPDAFAHDAAARMLGLSVAEFEKNRGSMVKDMVGEITNMTVGGFKNALCDMGLPCMLTLPTIMRGENLSIASIKGAERHTFHFDCGGHRLIADIQLKQE